MSDKKCHFVEGTVIVLNNINSQWVKAIKHASI